MVASLLVSMFALAVPAASLAATAADSARATAPADSARPASRVVRRFPEVEVRALLHDLRSSQTVHVIPSAALRAWPVDGLADALALQPGVVALEDGLHVRGGRAGETSVTLDGMTLNEPSRRRAMDVPLYALRSAELVSGAPDARHGGGIAGALDLRGADPTARPELEWKWQGDAGLDTRYDRVALRASAPLRRTGLGVVAAGDVAFDDTHLPMLRTESRREIAGVPFGWRAENRLLGSLKLAPIEAPERFAAEVYASRQVSRPYDPSWSVDGWIEVPVNLKETPKYSPTPQPGYLRYRAADHLGITDERRIAAQVRVGTRRGARRASLGLSWLHARAWHSIDGRREAHEEVERPRYGSALDTDPFYVLWGDDPLYSESGSDVITLRGEVEHIGPGGSVAGGAAIAHERARLYELDHQPLGTRSFDPGVVPLDSVRTYGVAVPSAHAWVQSRWSFEGLVLNAGLRAEYFTPGETATSQTLPGTRRGIWSFGPRLGIAYPLSPRDVFALAYVRIHQAPGRDFLYDQRTAIGDRQPLGNPRLAPATAISYEASVRHVFDAQWALQSSVFYRDVFGQIGAIDAHIPQGPANLRYTDEDQGHAAGFEWALVHAAGDGRRFEARYTWMQAWGNESRPGGDPYGPVRSAETPAIGNQPLSWDRRHSVAVSGAWRWGEQWSLAWSSLVGSPLPWTPKPRRYPMVDPSVQNSRRLGWTESTNLSAGWTPARARGLTFGVEVRNLFDGRYERAVTVDGYPNPVINTLYDDYGAYRTETGESGGAYWSQIGSQPGRWIPVHDPRLYQPPRTIRASVGARW
jgi:hypothetical protein